MKLIEWNWHPTDRQVREFAMLMLVLFPLLAWSFGAPWWVLLVGQAIAAFIACLAWLAPKVILPVYIGLMLAATPIGMVLGELALFAIYLGIFVPLGLLFRLMRRDPLKLVIDRRAPSYWEEKRTRTSPASFYEQY